MTFGFVDRRSIRLSYGPGRSILGGEVSVKVLRGVQVRYFFRFFFSFAFVVWVAARPPVGV